MENYEEKCEPRQDNPCSSKNDLKTFVIALLTAVIVTVIYHGITCWLCRDKSCSQTAQTIYVIHQNEGGDFHHRPERPMIRRDRSDLRRQDQQDMKRSFRGRHPMNQRGRRIAAKSQPAPAAAEKAAPAENSAK